MKVVNMRLSSGASKIRCNFDLETSEGITIKGYKIAEGASGLFVGVPSEKDKTGIWRDRVFMPKELKDELTEIAIKEYNQMAGSGSTSSPGAASTTTMPF